MSRLARLIVLTISIANCATARPQTPLLVQYSERPPFMMREPDGSMGGIVGEPAARAFKNAGIAVTWEMSASKRQLAVLQANAAPVCSIGWYKTPEREKFAKFTKAVSQDSTMIALANADFHAPDYGKLDDLLSRPTINVLVKDSVFYGAYLQERLQTMKARRIVSIDEYGSIVRLVRLGRVQLTFIPIEEANYYIEKMSYSRSDFHIIHFADMPPGEKRYIMCSRKVDDAVIEKLNAQISFAH